MFRRAALALTCAAVLIGCVRPAAGPGTTAPPPPQATTGAPAPPSDTAPATTGSSPASAGPDASQTPAPPDISTPAGASWALARFCLGPYQTAPDLPPDRLATLLQTILGTTPFADLEAVLPSKLVQAQCVHADFTRPPEPALLVATVVGADQGAILWQKDGRWLADATPGLEEYPEILRQEQRPGLREAFIAGRMSGTGGAGALHIFRLDGDHWKTVMATGHYDHFAPQALDGDNILVTARNIGNVPQAWTANCCVPTDYQWLWQRQGDTFTLAAERRAPDPYYTLDIFFGALQQSRTDAIGRLAAPEAVAQAVRLHLDTPDLGVVPEYNTVFAVTNAELNHWSALPPALNGPPPTQTALTVTVKLGGDMGAVQVTLKRVGEEWVVTGVSAP